MNFGNTLIDKPIATNVIKGLIDEVVSETIAPYPAPRAPAILATGPNKKLEMVVACLSNSSAANAFSPVVAMINSGIRIKAAAATTHNKTRLSIGQPPSVKFEICVCVYHIIEKLVNTILKYSFEIVRFVYTVI